MKQSKYNFIFSLDDEYIIYNSFTGAVAKLNDYEMNCYNTMMFDDSKLLEEFYYGGFIIKDYFDELESLKMNFMKKRYSESVLSLCIAPTLNCNFKCSYCFENDIRCSGSITDEVMDSIFEYLNNNLENTKELIVTWYGGEPLLEIDKINYMSEKFIDICDNNNVKYHSSMITNGYLLTKNNINKINKCSIEYLQVTLDGNKYWHDKKRPFVDGRDTYEKIVSNIKENIEILPKINIRINLDKNNKHTFFEVINEFKNIKDNISIYLAKVDNNNDTYKDNLCINNIEYLESILQSNICMNMSNINTILISNKSVYCNAQLYYSIVIDNQGYMYKCWTDIGYSNRSFGNIKKLSDINNTKFSEYFEIDPFSDKECLNCKYLPLCIGGCPYQFKNRNKRQCTFIKNNLRKVLIKN